MGDKPKCEFCDNPAVWRSKYLYRCIHNGIGGWMKIRVPRRWYACVEHRDKRTPGIELGQKKEN